MPGRVSLGLGWKNQQGFTLIEMLIALLIMVVGFLGVAIVLWLSMQSGTNSRSMSTAANLGQDMLEHYTAQSYSALSDTAGAFVPYTSSNISATGFVREVRIQNDYPEAGVKTITARISWRSGGVARTRTFTMLKRDY